MQSILSFRVSHKNLIATQLIKKFPAFHENTRFITQNLTVEYKNITLKNISNIFAELDEICILYLVQVFCDTVSL
jgi:hypothetical protein